MIQLLRSNKNLILTGAPGTGKTYMAKQIALMMLFNKESEEALTNTEKKILHEQLCITQFHPSYDYTDFVEGLRPIQNEDCNTIGFERKDGIFKAFCEKAQKKLNTCFDSIYTELKEEGEKQLTIENTTFSIKASNNDPNKINIQLKEDRPVEETKIYIHKTPTCEEIKDSLKNAYDLFDKYKIDKYPFIFIIDEINRGEISKIFGELFFSIDPEYRGKKGRVQTQYANIIKENDFFKEGFYVPENVYIIGTMNDIDRSVECIDFAMRRRFAWKEISAKDSMSMLSVLGEFEDEAKDRLTAINNTIWNEETNEGIEGLSPSYHIGASYFLKLTKCNYDFHKLWENHLRGILYEYLRGMPDAIEKMNLLKNAYNFINDDE